MNKGRGEACRNIMKKTNSSWYTYTDCLSLKDDRARNLCNFCSCAFHAIKDYTASRNFLAIWNTRRRGSTTRHRSQHSKGKWRYQTYHQLFTSNKYFQCRENLWKRPESNCTGLIRLANNRKHSALSTQPNPHLLFSAALMPVSPFSLRYWGRYQTRSPWGISSLLWHWMTSCLPFRFGLTCLAMYRETSSRAMVPASTLSYLKIGLVISPPTRQQQLFSLEQAKLCWLLFKVVPAFFFFSQSHQSEPSSSFPSQPAVPQQSSIPAYTNGSDTLTNTPALRTVPPRHPDAPQCKCLVSIPL